MATMEMQTREDAFLELMRAEFLRVDLPSEVVADLAAQGKNLPFINEELLIERVEIPDIQIVDSVPKTGPAERGKLYLKVQIHLLLTTYTNAEKAGHLSPPATLPLIPELTVWIRLELNLKKSVKYALVDASGELGTAGQSLRVDGTLPLPMPAPLDRMPIWTTAIFARDGVIVFRMGSDLEDLTNESFLTKWDGNRLGLATWGVFIEGAVFAHEVARQLNRAAEQAAKGTADPKFTVVYPDIDPAKALPYHNGSWILPQRHARAVVVLEGSDSGLMATIGEFLGIKIRAVMWVTLEIRPILGTGIELMTSIEWSGPDEIQSTLLNNLRAAFAGQKEVAQGDSSISFSQTAWPRAPRSRSSTGGITGIDVNDLGLAITGTLQARPRPVATWSATLPSWGFSGDCRSKSVQMKLKSPGVELASGDPYWTPRLMLPVRAQPSLFWDAVEHSQLPGSLPITLSVELRPAGRLLGDVPPNIAVSAYLYTNYGVRWADLGVIPSKPEVSEKELLVRTAVLISDCMAISDRWGMGVLNLDWLVDPPDVSIDFGLPPLLEWMVLGNQVQEVDEVHLTAVRRDGERRPLGSASTAGDMLLLHRIMTDADETLELRTDALMAGPAPGIMYRWIMPQRVIGFNKAVASFSLDGPLLRVLHDDESLIEVHLDSSPDETCSDQVIELSVIEAQGGDGRPAVGGVASSLAAAVNHRYDMKTMPAEMLSQNFGSVAVLHKNAIVIGVAGQFKNAANRSQEKRPASEGTTAGNPSPLVQEIP